ncbi:MAG: hypothetical protein V3V86_01240 [Gammaproteobacteria bacterium]
MTFQQLQKYERGTNRIAASRLYHLSLIFSVPVSDFSQGIGGRSSTRLSDDVMVRTETLKFVCAYDRIRDPKVRDALRAMIIAIAKRAESP